MRKHYKIVCSGIAALTALSIIAAIHSYSTAPMEGTIAAHVLRYESEQGTSPRCWSTVVTLDDGSAIRIAGKIGKRGDRVTVRRDGNRHELVRHLSE